MIKESLAQPAHQTTPDSTRHHRCDYEFLGLLEEDFGLDLFSLNRAFMGVSATPKKQAIALCEWAIRAAKGDAMEAGKALRAWAKKNNRGQYARQLLEATETTYEHNEHVRSIGRLS